MHICKRKVGKKMKDQIACSGNHGVLKKLFRFAFVLAMLFFSIMLVGCASSEKKSIESQTETEVEVEVEADVDVEIEESLPKEDSSVPEPAVGKAPLECEGIVFKSGAVIEGTQLGDCMVVAMLAAVSGTHRVESSGDSPTVVDFQWNPDFSMNIKGESHSVIIKGDTGWFEHPKGNWIQEDEHSTEPEVVMASGIIKAVRTLSNPLFLREYLAMSPTWTVVGEEPVPASDAFVDVAWHLVPEGPINMEIVTLTDVGVWLSNDYLGAYFVSTSTGMGITVTTSNTFLQWGEPVDIPDPTQ
jgi:hypothetical protein